MTPKRPASALTPALLLEDHLHTLRAHLGQCRHARGPMFALGCLAERVHARVAGRFVTTVMVAVAVLPLAASWS